jgi:hypothetical protein
MSNEDRAEAIDKVLDLLTKPLNRYILSVLAGADPGVFAESDENHASDLAGNKTDCTRGQ